jgi:hypothetical protein
MSRKFNLLKQKKMKKLILMLLVVTAISFNVNAQKVVKVKITTKTTITDALEKCKEAGKKKKMGSRDYEANEETGKVTLWRSVSKEDFYCEITATQKDGITTLNFRMPHTPGLMSSNWTKELKKITKHLQLPEMMVGEYFDGIE